MARGTPSSIAGFLRERLHYPDSEALRRLDSLAGERIGRTRFLPDLEAARGILEPWMPLFFLPVGSHTDPVGLHLRPSDVRAGRLAVLAAEGPAEFVEIATAPEQLVYFGLLGQEAVGNSGPVPDAFAPSVAKANAVFGEGFYVPGRHGKFHSGDEPLVMLEQFGGTPHAIDIQATLAEEPAAKLGLWERGVALGTDSLAMHAGAARMELELGRRDRAAAHCARSLDCYHHTAYEVDLDDYFDEARPLLDEFPALFSEDAAWQLREPDPRGWARRAAELFQSGQAQRADKLLNDLCHGTGDYDAALGAFRKHYAALGWDWALALCELRS